MEILIGVISILIAVLIALIPFFRRKYFLRPELTVDIKSKGGGSSPLGLSGRNDFSKGAVDGRTALRIFEVTWRFEIRLTNNSDQIALYPEFDFNPNGRRFTKIDQLNKLEPIKPGETITLKAEYTKFEEKIGSERTHVGEGPPEELDDLNILVTYQNQSKQAFFTLFDNSFSNDKNKFIRTKPQDFKIK